MSTTSTEIFNDKLNIVILIYTNIMTEKISILTDSYNKPYSNLTYSAQFHED